MKDINYKKLTLNALWLCAVCLILYGFSRLYYHSTGGFSIHNIRSNYTYDERWKTRALTDEEIDLRDSVLAQKFYYLGKGCQSYVFASEDGDYVIKFFKYQRMRAPIWLEYFTFVPGVNEYRQNKIDKKRVKREGVFSSWKLAFDRLPKETGTTFVHLNKSETLNIPVRIIDKAGYEHVINIDDYEFMIQKRATMLCDEIDELMKDGEINTAENMLITLVDTILSEYHQGLADNDHALMQNTGVFHGTPVHIDIGQFVEEEIVKDPDFHMQELYTKTYKFRLWLREEHPQLCDRFEEYLQSVMGEQFQTMKPLWRDRIEIFQ